MKVYNLWVSKFFDKLIKQISALSFKKVILIFICAGLIVYTNSLFNNFLGDDSSQILQNNSVHSIANLWTFLSGSTFQIDSSQGSVGLYYKPLLLIVFSAIYTFFGASSFFFHLTSLLLQISNSLLIYLIFKKHFKNSLPFFLSLIFLIHPINNESVVYISGLQEPLFAFFGLLALNLIVYQKKLYLALPLLLFSLLSKETGVLFIPIILIYYHLFYPGKTARLSRIFYFSSILVIAVYAFLRIDVGNIGLQTKLLYMSENATLIERLYTIPTILTYYLRMSLFPYTIATLQYWVIKIPNLFNFTIPLVIDAAAAILIIIPETAFVKLSQAERKVYFFFLSIFIISLLPVLQIFPLDSTVSDRWFYLPLFGLSGMIGTAAEKVMVASPDLIGVRRVWVIGVVIILLGFGVRDFTRNFDWQDNYTLCKHDSQINTQSYVLEYCLSNELYNRGQMNLALSTIQRAISLYPKYFFSYDTLGKIYFNQGQFTQAQSAFEKTLTLNDFGYGSDEVALVMDYQQKPQEAKTIAKQYLLRLPDKAELWYALSLADYQLQNYSEATSEAKQAYILEPSQLSYKLYYRLQNNLPISIK